MAESTLQARLRDHAKAFDGLLSLIPAKYYYGEDTSDQWQKKKQTKEEAAAARRAKLDPASAKSAKDVMDERARKRKLDEVNESDVEGVEKELPKQGLKILEKTSKKQKTESTAPARLLSKLSSDPSPTEQADDIKARKNAKAEQKRLKQQQKKEKLAKKTEKMKGLKEQSGPETLNEDAGGSKVVAGTATPDVQLDDEVITNDENTMGGSELGDLELEGLVDAQRSTASPVSAPASPTFDNPTGASTNTSTSSIVPPARAPKHIKMPTDPELLKARLAARIEALRAARKADGPNGAPARNRQELMEARRKKEEQRQAHKKELRMKARAEEEARREEALASARDSPASSMMSPAIHTASENNFSFGRVAFADGQQLTDDLATLVTAPKRKGPQDPATALQATENKRQRLAGLDSTKRASVEEKDLWLSAKKRARGEKVRDDASLLKKTLKRKEKAKKRSEKEWGERKEGVAKGQAVRQKKREENLRKRRDEKGEKGKGKSNAGKKSKPKSRPGFEGSFSAGGKRR